jgi:DNA repair protein RadC
MKDLPLEERPYEKMEKYGSGVLSDAELLAIIIRTGGKDDTSVGVAQKLIKECVEDGGIKALNDISLEELKNIKGIGRVKAIQIKAVVELTKRFSSFKQEDKTYINCPWDISKFLMEEMRYLKQEHFRIILLNVKNEVVKCLKVSIGTLNSSLVHPRDVFSEPIRCKCASIILVHNHPSGDPNPSEEDINITKRLIEAGRILGINVLDHIIIGDGKYISFKERGII